MSNRRIFDTLRGAGLTLEGACGLMGNMAAESGMKANIAQRGMTRLSDEDYTAAADNGSIDFARDSVGYGLCQWTYHTRKAGLLAFAQSRGLSVGDEGMQAEYCLKELREQYRDVYAFLTASHDLLQCTQLVCTDYERPAHNNVGTRLEFAQQFYSEFGGGKGQEKPAADACPLFPPDPSVMIIQMVMNYNGYWGKPDGYKSPEFFAALRQFTEEMGRC